MSYTQRHNIGRVGFILDLVQVCLYMDELILIYLGVRCYDIGLPLSLDVNSSSELRSWTCRLSIDAGVSSELSTCQIYAATWTCIFSFDISSNSEL
jgi:hypothetical protein